VTAPTDPEASADEEERSRNVLMAEAAAAEVRALEILDSGVRLSFPMVSEI
jgi:hypothetical protein